MNGASISSDDDADKRFYGKPLKAAEIIFQGLADPNVPSEVKDWQATLARHTTATVTAK